MLLHYRLCITQNKLDTAQMFCAKPDLDTAQNPVSFYLQAKVLNQNQIKQHV